MATEKQINYAKTLGIENPEQYDTKALSKMIDEKLGKSKKVAQNGSKQLTVATQVVINKNENQDSIEWRKSTGKGVKCYGDADKPEEFHKRLGVMIDILNAYDDDDDDLAPTVKPEDL